MLAAQLGMRHSAHDAANQKGSISEDSMKITREGFHRRRGVDVLGEAHAASQPYTTGWYLKRVGPNEFQIRLASDDAFGPKGQRKHTHT
jgi:hypothetical protein